MQEPYVSPPLGFCGFIRCLEPPIDATINRKRFVKDRYRATGQVTAPMVGEVLGSGIIRMVFIRRCGLHQMFGIGMSLLTNTSIPLAE